jgi:hypothetical protein
MGSPGGLRGDPISGKEELELERPAELDDAESGSGVEPVELARGESERLDKMRGGVVVSREESSVLDEAWEDEEAEDKPPDCFMANTL